MGQLLFWDTWTIVPDADHRVVLFPDHRHVHPAAGAAVLVRVVQQVAEHLPQPLRVSSEGGEGLLRLGVVQFQPFPAEELPVGVHRILQLGHDVQRLH